MSIRTFQSLSGRELATLRREAGLTQTQLAIAARIGRHAVSRWEQMPSVDPWGWAPKRMFEVLGIEVLPHKDSSTRTGAGARHGVLSELDRHVVELVAREEAGLDAKRQARQAHLAVRQGATQARLAAREKEAKAHLRVPCGACTREGEPCRMRSEPGRRRYRLYGGMSTGPRTPEGRARIAEAQRRRWAARREVAAA